MRYLRLYLCFLRFSFSRALQFRLDFFFRVVMDLAYYGVNLVLFAVLFRQTPAIGGWDMHQTRVFMAGFMVVDAITMTVFSNNLWWLPIFINRGDLDYYLVRPVSSLFFLTLRDFAANSFLNLVCAIGILVWSLASYPSDLPWGRLPFLVAGLGIGASLHAMLYLLTVLPSFWIESAHGLHGIFYSFARLMERPDRVYTGTVRRILTTILPFALIASFPARIFWEGHVFALGMQMLLAAVGLFLFILLLWNKGINRYGSASS